MIIEKEHLDFLRCGDKLFFSFSFSQVLFCRIFISHICNSLSNLVVSSQHFIQCNDDNMISFNRCSREQELLSHRFRSFQSKILLSFKSNFSMEFFSVQAFRVLFSSMISTFNLQWTIDKLILKGFYTLPCITISIRDSDTHSGPTRKLHVFLKLVARSL